VELVRLIYGSHLSKDCTPGQLEDILASSRKNNRRSGVTGALAYSSTGFLQCLEGSAREVNKLYRRIIRDDRHEDITLFEYVSVKERTFDEWTMACIRHDKVDRAILSKTRGPQKFDPFDMTAGEALTFLKNTVRERRAFLEKQERAANS